MNLHGTLRRIVLSALLLAGVAHADRVPAADPDDGQTFRVLAFHDVRDSVRASFAEDPDETAVSDSQLLDFFTWLQQRDYHPVSLQQIVAARSGGAPLPANAVLLSFDDGYRSEYTRVFPLLRRFHYPAVMALVTSWLDVPENGKIDLGNKVVGRDYFITWKQATEMARSGLVELASHTDAMHHGILANPQGNSMPAAATLAYDRQSNSYESDEAYRKRVAADLLRSRQRIEARTGAHVRALAWPYGAYNDIAVEAAKAAGLPITLTLDEGANDPAVPLYALRRELPSYELDSPGYLDLLRVPPSGQLLRTNRVVQVDLDYVYDPDPRQQEANLSKLVERIAEIGPTSVFLQAYADPDGDGTADALYFPNRYMPMRADLFSRAAWQLETRARVKVYAWMPVSAFRLPADNAAAARLVQTLQPDGSLAPSKPQRLSPFDPQAREVIKGIYADLAKHAPFSGVLFNDDAVLSDYEDASPAALQVYQQWGLPADLRQIRANPELASRWAAQKSRYLTDFTLELARGLRAWHPALRTARNLFARPLLDPQAQAWFAQDYAQFLAAYDYTALMAMPAMEGAADPDAWLESLVKQVAATPQGLENTIFELQARDWRDGKPIPDETLARQFSLLHRRGARNAGYYPDDFLKDQPGLATARDIASVRSQPREDKPKGSESPTKADESKAPDNIEREGR